MLTFEIKEFQTGSYVSSLWTGALDSTWRCLRQMDVDERALQAEGSSCDSSQGQAGPSLRVCTASCFPFRERRQAEDVTKKGAAAFCSSRLHYVHVIVAPTALNRRPLIE